MKIFLIITGIIVSFLSGIAYQEQVTPEYKIAYELSDFGNIIAKEFVVSPENERLINECQ